ncbi:MAG: HD-GYP domain-containing protein, partial [Sulfurimicrobium sp.]|nr:HD-GYP domain-containing protein [Sulfurimicrobium sp.]
HCLGVYPPGSIVQLSNEMLGMVVSVNSAKPLKPNVLVYDPDIPKDEAVIVSLEREAELNISKSLRPGQLPREVYQYLDPRKRVTYYFDPKKQNEHA